MQQDKRQVPDWLLERLALGELDADAAADVRRRLAAEGRSADDVFAAVAASNREILSELPTSQAAAEIRRRAIAAAAMVPAPRRRALMVFAPLALAGGVAALLLTAPAERMKGPEPSAAARLYIYRHGADGDQRLADGAAAARGDLVQLAYRSHRGGYGVLLSIDGARKVTLHWPERQDGTAAALDPSGGERRLPSAYELDDAPAFERFFLVRAASAFPVATALQAARTLAAQPSAHKQSLALPPDFEQISLALDKTPAAKKELP